MNETTTPGLYTVSVGGAPPELLTLAELHAKMPGIGWTDIEIEASITALRPFHITDPGVPHVRISVNAND